MRNYSKHEKINREFTKINYSQLVEELYMLTEFTDSDIKRAAKKQINTGVHLNGAFFDSVVVPFTNKLKEAKLLQIRRTSGVRIYTIIGAKKAAIAVFQEKNNIQPQQGAEMVVTATPEPAPVVAEEGFHLPKTLGIKPKHNNKSQEEYVKRMSDYSLSWIILAYAASCGKKKSLEINKMVGVTGLDLKDIKEILTRESEEQILCMSSGIGRGSTIEISTDPDKVIDWGCRYYQKLTGNPILYLDDLKEGKKSPEEFYEFNKLKPVEIQKPAEAPVVTKPSVEKIIFTKAEEEVNIPTVTPKKATPKKEDIYDKPEVAWTKSIIVGVIQKYSHGAPIRIESLTKALYTEKGITMSNGEVNYICREMQRTIGGITYLPGDTIRVDDFRGLRRHYHPSKFKDSFHVVTKMTVEEFKERYNLDNVKVVMNENDNRYLLEINGTREAKFEKAIIDINRDLRQGEIIIGSSYMVNRVLTKGLKTRDIEEYIRCEA